MQFPQFVDFVRRLYKTDQFIPLHEPRFYGNEKKYLNECIDSTFVSSVGRFVDLFELKISEYTGAKYAVAAVNGTAALHMALLLSDVGYDDEVITQPITFVATANSIAYTGASPVFIDVDKDTLGLSPEKLEHWLNLNTTHSNDNRQPITINKKSGKQIKACIPMHTFGHPCRIDKIVEICNNYNITVIEDAAESLGSYYKGKHTGTFGKLATLSFNGNKTITTGGGGMILTDNEDLAKLAKHLTTQAKVPHKWEYIHDFIGYNYRLTNLAAAVGVAQLEQLSEFIKAKRELANSYKDFFNNSNIEFFNEPNDSQSNYWLNTILFDNRNVREEFLEYTNQNGIMTRPVWKMINELPMYKKCQTGDLSNAGWLADRIVNLPSSVIL